MLFFRSEDMVQRWCEKRGFETRPIVSMDQLWSLAERWYSNRLEPDARRPKVSEAKEIFEMLGLQGEFWDLESETLR